MSPTVARERGEDVLNYFLNKTLKSQHSFKEVEMDRNEI